MYYPMYWGPEKYIKCCNKTKSRESGEWRIGSWKLKGCRGRAIKETRLMQWIWRCWTHQFGIWWNCRLEVWIVRWGM